jgi:hypothetical protein
MRITEITQPGLPIPPTTENVDRAKAFLLRKWRERAAERQHEEPADLSNACKFASLFAQRIFGGQLRGNWDHQYLILPNGQRLDLTEPSQNLAGIRAEGRDPYRHDRRFWNNRDHRESLASCRPRVDRWVSEFLAQTGLSEARRMLLYHGTLKENVPSILGKGLQPRVGSFVRAAYGNTADLPPATFAATKSGLIKVIAAIVAAINQKLGLGGITDDEFFRYGAVVVLERTPDWYRTNHPQTPRQAEPGDYWTQATVTPVKVLVDDELERFIGVAPSEINDFVYDNERDRDRGIKW